MTRMSTSAHYGLPTGIGLECPHVHNYCRVDEKWVTNVVLEKVKETLGSSIDESEVEEDGLRLSTPATWEPAWLLNVKVGAFDVFCSGSLKKE
jgi:hypothetical protein